jgi:hypothetical protein
LYCILSPGLTLRIRRAELAANALDLPNQVIDGRVASCANDGVYEDGSGDADVERADDLPAGRIRD